MNFLQKALERLWFSCGGHCHTHGDQHAACPLMNVGNPPERWQDPQARRFSAGPALVGACAAVFLLPLATAAVGAFLAGKYLAADSPTSLGVWQLVGAVAGLAVGVAVAKLILAGVRAKQTGSGGGEE